MNQNKDKKYYNPKDERTYQERLKFLLHYYKELTDITKVGKEINEFNDPLNFPLVLKIKGKVKEIEINTSTRQELRDKINALRYWVLEDILRGVSIQVDLDLKGNPPNPETEISDKDK